MAEAINIAVHLHPGENFTHSQEELPEMAGDVCIQLNTPERKSFRIRISRIPVVGEMIKINHDIYIVRSVLHTPNASHAAELEGELCGLPRT